MQKASADRGNRPNKTKANSLPPHSATKRDRVCANQRFFSSLLGVCQRFEGRNVGWRVRVPGGSTPVPLIVVRLQEGNLEILDYVLLDCCPVRKESFRLSEASVKNCPKGTAEEVVAELISRSRLQG